jgi:hypothetical protein
MIESDGAKLSEAERIDAGIEACRRNIKRWQETLRLLLWEGYESCKPTDKGAVAVDRDGELRPAITALPSPYTVWMRKRKTKG